MRMYKGAGNKNAAVKIDGGRNAIGSNAAACRHSLFVKELACNPCSASAVVTAGESARGSSESAAAAFYRFCLKKTIYQAQAMRERTWIISWPRVTSLFQLAHFGAMHESLKIENLTRNNNDENKSNEKQQQKQ